MTKFDITKFDLGRGSERWVTYEGKFVARFKYMNAAACARHFVKFLAKNFTVEEYFEMLNTKNPDNTFGNKYAPAEVLETKGYIGYNIQKRMKEYGCSTKEEYMEIFRKQMTDMRENR